MINFDSEEKNCVSDLEDKLLHFDYLSVYIEFSDVNICHFDIPDRCSIYQFTY